MILSLNMSPHMCGVLAFRLFSGVSQPKPIVLTPKAPPKIVYVSSAFVFAASKRLIL